jgi:hypothetical protein
MNNVLLIGISIALLALSGYLTYRVIALKKELEPLRIKHPRSCTSFNYDYSNVEFEGIINYTTAQSMADNYKNDYGKAYISSQDQFAIEKPDTRSVWFSLDRLKKFIWNIERQNCLNGCAESLGLRIYFAKYPDLNNADALDSIGLIGLIGVPKEYSNHHTLFMVPTYENDNGVNVDYYPGGDCRAGFNEVPTIKKFIADVDNPGVRDIPGPTPMIFDMGINEDAQNHGNLIPPGEATGTRF